MDNSDKIKLKHMLMMATSNYGIGLITMDTSKRLSYLCQALDSAGENFKKYKEMVLKSLYTNNKSVCQMADAFM